MLLAKHIPFSILNPSLYINGWEEAATECVAPREQYEALGMELSALPPQSSPPTQPSTDSRASKFFIHKQKSTVPRRNGRKDPSLGRQTAGVSKPRSSSTITERLHSLANGPLIAVTATSDTVSVTVFDIATTASPFCCCSPVSNTTRRRGYFESHVSPVAIHDNDWL